MSWIYTDEISPFHMNHGQKWLLLVALKGFFKDFFVCIPEEQFIMFTDINIVEEQHVWDKTNENVFVKSSLYRVSSMVHPTRMRLL